MGYSSIQGWPTPFFGAEFTAATPTVKPKNSLKGIERLAKGWAVRVPGRTVSTAGRDADRERKTPRSVFADKNNKSGVFIMLSMQRQATVPAHLSRFQQTVLASFTAARPAVVPSRPSLPRPVSAILDEQGKEPESPPSYHTQQQLLWRQ
ncbi:hypothetical protein V3H56_06940 [Pseudomonas sp. MS646]|uniref:hypothetical protein n=1 Tax=Pseudomonas sp. MS646 TaxID=3118751 RepID=UPI0030CD0A3E